MKAIELQEMQRIELNLLLELDKICNRFSLRYYIDGGTLLGAMCYEGFIPWDDDIDIKMPRPDYNRLLGLYNEFPSHISLDSPSAEHCQYTMLKLIDNRTVLKEYDSDTVKTTGIYLDVFPMDGYPPKGTERERHLKKLNKLNSLFHSSLVEFQNMCSSKNFLSRVKGLLYQKIYTPWKLYQRLTDLAEKYEYEKADQVGLLVEGNPVKECFNKEWLDDKFKLEFEGHMVSAPRGYKRHLEIFYGEHITKPEYHHNLPVIQPNHKHEVFWKE